MRVGAHLLDKPLDNWENVDKVETLNLLRLEREWTLHLDQRLDDLLTQLTEEEECERGRIASKQVSTARVYSVVSVRAPVQRAVFRRPMLRNVHLHTKASLFLEEDIDLHIGVCERKGGSALVEERNAIDGFQQTQATSTVAPGKKLANNAYSMR